MSADARLHLAARPCGADCRGARCSTQVFVHRRLLIVMLACLACSRCCSSTWCARRAALQLGFLHQLSVAQGRARRNPVGLGRHSLIMLVTAIVRGAGRRRGGDLSRGVRAEELVHGDHRDQHHEPRRRALDRLRPAGAGLFVYQFDLGQSITAAGLTLALLILPIVIVATREAIRSVPQGDPRGGLRGCGATRWEVTRTTCCRIRPAASSPA